MSPRRITSLRSVTFLMSPPMISWAGNFNGFSAAAKKCAAAGVWPPKLRRLPAGGRTFAFRPLSLFKVDALGFLVFGLFLDALFLYEKIDGRGLFFIFPVFFVALRRGFLLGLFGFFGFILLFFADPVLRCALDRPPAEEGQLSCVYGGKTDE